MELRLHTTDIFIYKGIDTHENILKAAPTGDMRENRKIKIKNRFRNFYYKML